MSFLKEIRSHLQKFESEAKTEIESFIAHLESIYADHHVVALSQKPVSSAPPTANDSSTAANTAPTISVIQQQVIAIAAAAPVPAPAPVAAPVEAPAPVAAPVEAPVEAPAALTTTAPAALAPTSVAPVAGN